VRRRSLNVSNEKFKRASHLRAAAAAAAAAAVDDVKRVTLVLKSVIRDSDSVNCHVSAVICCLDWL